VRAALRWLGRTAGSLLTALLLVGLGFYLHFLWHGPELKPWHRVRFTAEFKASDYAAGRVTTLARYREREQLLLDQVRTDIAKRLVPADRLPYNRFVPGSRSDPGVWAFNWNRTFVLQPAGDPIGGVLLLHASRTRRTACAASRSRWRRVVIASSACACLGTALRLRDC
jgi:hypothetical protein